MKSGIFLASLALACGAQGGSSDSAFASATATASAGSTTAEGPTSTSSSGPGGPTSTGGDTTSLTTDASSSSSTTTTDLTSTGGTSMGATSTGSSTGGESSTGEPLCSLPDVPDLLGFTYSRTIDLVDITILLASYYNSDAGEIVFLSPNGVGRRFTIDGVALGDVTLPPQAMPMLNAASYDPVGQVALLLTQGCMLVEAEPVTLAATKVTQLDKAKLEIDICDGVAIGVDGDLYVVSWKTQELVRLTRDGQNVVARVDLIAAGVPRPTGLSLIAGSENFMVLSLQDQTATILAPDGAVVVPPGVITKALPLKGGNFMSTGALLSVCGNGHVWVCKDYGSRCHEFAPESGDMDACACTVPQ